MAEKHRKDGRYAKRQEDLPKEYQYKDQKDQYGYEDREQDHLDDYNKLGKEYYYDEETDKSVFHDNRHDSGNR